MAAVWPSAHARGRPLWGRTSLGHAHRVRLLKERLRYRRASLHPYPSGILLAFCSAGHTHRDKPLRGKAVSHRPPYSTRHPADIRGPLSPLAVSCLPSVPTAPDRCPTQLSHPDALGIIVLPLHPTTLKQPRQQVSSYPCPGTQNTPSQTPKSEITIDVVVVMPKSQFNEPKH